MEKKPQSRRILGKSALAITLSGPTAGAAQIYNYDHIREVRMDLEKLEVTVLMTYEDAYQRVFNVDAINLTEEQREIVKKQVLKFYNDLITASMKFTNEEIDNLKKQHENLKKKIEEAQAKSSEETKSSEEK
jgi:hypothetical protein